MIDRTLVNPISPTEPVGPTGQLSIWLSGSKLSDVPASVRERAKYLLLDGLGCLLFKSNIAWSRLGVDAILDFDGTGNCMIAGCGDKRTSVFSAAMRNSSFIQAFEFDDYFPDAPLHSNSILVPAMLPILEKEGHSEQELLLAVIIGYEQDGAGTSHQAHPGRMERSGSRT